VDGVAERIAAQFEDGGWRFVEELPSASVFETLHVDFKQPEGADGQLRRRDRQQLSRALSGFANSDGGVIVWGVEARRDDEGFDRVVRVHPILNLPRFVSDLSSAEPHLVSPLVPGVRHLPVDHQDEEGTGIALTIVPASDWTPHMAVGKDLHRYYRRSGSSFLPLQHHEVADLFGRRPHPDLRLESIWSVRRASMTDGRATSVALELHLRIVNRGRGSARFASLSLGEPRGLRPDTRGGRKIHGSSLREVRSAQHWWMRVAAASDDLVYPDDEMYVGYVAFPLPRDVCTCPNVSVEYSLVCDGVPAEAGALEAAGEGIASAAQRVFEGGSSRVELA